VTIIKPPLPTRALGSARDLRHESTDAERKLWQYLRAGRLDGRKFRRQHPIPPYIVDFCCVTAKVIVELDGSQHTEAADRARTRYLQAQGWRVLRFWDHDALARTEPVVDAIWNAVVAPNPLPNPSPDGRGA
jgi:very-short-patch-repair endonuclease